MCVVPNLVFQNNLYVSHFFMTFFGGVLSVFFIVSDWRALKS